MFITICIIIIIALSVIITIELRINIKSHKLLKECHEVTSEWRLLVMFMGRDSVKKAYCGRVKEETYTAQVIRNDKLFEATRKYELKAN